MNTNAAIEGLTLGADAIILSTDWPQYLSLDWTKIAQRMQGTFVFDARNALDAHAITAVGLKYGSYGRRAAARVITS